MAPILTVNRHSVNIIIIVRMLKLRNSYMLFWTKTKYCQEPNDAKIQVSLTGISLVESEKN